MARRSAVARGRDTAVAEETAAPGGALGSSADPWDMPEPRRRRGRSGGDGGRGGGGGRWGGSGGRWWVWVGRVILWAVLLVILVNGVIAPFKRFTADDTGSPRTPKPGRDVQFPSSAASAFAVQFATVYLNYDQKNAAPREAQLRAFLPDGAAGQFGWNGVGALQVQSVQAAGVDVRDAANGTVRLLARSQDRWLRLDVPVYADKSGAMVVSGRPALLPPPRKAALPQSGVRERDTALESELQSFLDTFFRAYAHGEQAALSRFSDGTPIEGLADAVSLSSVKEVIVPKGAAAERTVTVTVLWQVAGAAGGGNGELEQTYRLTMVKGATWLVRDIRGTTEPSAS